MISLETNPCSTVGMSIFQSLGIIIMLPPETHSTPRKPLVRHSLSQMIHELLLHKFRLRLQEANQECARMRKKLEESVAVKRAMDEQNMKKDKRIHEISARLKQSDENARKQVDQVNKWRHLYGAFNALHCLAWHCIPRKAYVKY